MTLEEYLIREKAKAKPGSFIHGQTLEGLAEYGIDTVNKYLRWIDEECYVNMHKSTYGVKPSKASIDRMTDKELLNAIRQERFHDDAEEEIIKEVKSKQDCSFNIMANALAHLKGVSNV
jgi:hypothetical protein